jgi:diguanylate cyclase
MVSAVRVMRGAGELGEMDVQTAEGEASWQHFETAKTMMARNGHPATPEVYAVWYAYAARTEPALVQKIERAAISGETVKLPLILELHNIFFSHVAEGDMLRQTGDKVSAELGRMLQLLETAGRDTSSFGSALTQIAAKLEPDGELRKIVETVVMATRHMEAKTRRLEAELDRSAAEIRALRQGLETFKREAMTDPLTGLFNRRAFDERLRQAAAAAMENDAELCLFLSDIDNFKKLNDSWGHQVGDAVMQLVAGCLKEALRPTDTAARFGGDEYAAILPGLSIAEAHALAEKTRELVGRKLLRDVTSGESIGRMSISIGVASYALSERLEDLVKRADRALYAAKQNGRNQVVIERADGA